MRDGRVEQNGTPEELYNRPATDFTARFIGTPPMNVIARAGGMLGVRPEHIRIVSQDGHPARVKAVEHLGADSIVVCDIDGQNVAVRQDGFSKAGVGDTIRLTWDVQHEHWFHQQSGRRVAAPTSADRMVLA
jgi:sn-glycerol 3-phosphate transport system ATP-binding protein